MRGLIAWILVLVTVQMTNGQEKDQWPGKLSGQFRTYYLGTFNNDNLKDFQALAIGGKIKYVHTFWKHIKVGGALYTSVNSGIQDLSIPDPTTGKVSRYELGLFDVEHPNDHFILIPGELFFQYTHKKHEATIGRMKIASPFINPQDGRMIPTLEQGIWYKYQPNTTLKFQFGVFNAISPRSTHKFFGIGESIGKYPSGRTVDGKPSQYAKNTTSDYIALANIDLQASEGLKLSIWNYYVDNIFNTLYMKPTFDLGNQGMQVSLEWLHQNRIGTGGNSSDSLRYYAHSSADILGLEWRYKWKRSKVSIGYDHILNHGQFIFPREWGREVLFSFQKRERSEGSANNHAVVLTYARDFIWSSSKIQSIISLGHQWKADVTDAENNKYAMPDYTHLNLDMFYTHETLKHFEPELLLTYKLSHGEFPENANFVLNKVDMFQVNLIINYTFK
ncbi:OprD family outer membrane porin [Fulvivirga sp. 29W222]|uniref:OprD family outer membrane porin n=1 Tax=Fulvivirga marina TaxID=2494733 RepID=A0A937G0U5_9BACT|nr:OprD family outer membrane porin [Fulvivirga marina]MBL6448438.1 OprD family outer membrane porin [Fulvivirga marina]